MKRKINPAFIALVIILVFAGTAFAAIRVYNQATAVSLVAADVRADTYTSNDVDVRQYKGQGMVVLDAEAQGGGVTNDVVVQHSNLATGESVTFSGDAALDLNLATDGTTSLSAVFTVGSSTIQIKHVDLQLKKTGTIATDKVLTLTLHSNVTSTPSGTVLATASTYTANNVSSTNYQPVRFSLTTPYQLSPSTNYWVTLTTTYAASDTNYISWHVATVASGGTVASYATPTTTAVTTQRALFKTQKYEFANIVTFTQVGNAASFQSKSIDLDYAGTHLRTVGTVGGSSTGAYSVILVAPKIN